MTEAATVWVIDDDRSVRFVLAQALRDAGYAVLAFDSAAKALQALQDEPYPDLVFTDVPADEDRDIWAVKADGSAAPFPYRRRARRWPARRRA